MVLGHRFVHSSPFFLFNHTSSPYLAKLLIPEIIINTDAVSTITDDATARSLPRVSFAAVMVYPPPIGALRLTDLPVSSNTSNFPSALAFKESPLARLM